MRYGGSREAVESECGLHPLKPLELINDIAEKFGIPPGQVQGRSAVDHRPLEPDTAVRFRPLQIEASGR